jgi:RHS repeat-associated protein
VVDVQNKTYDAAGDLLTASNANGAYAFTYDASGRVTHVEEPFGVWFTYGYDSHGNRTSVTDSFGDTETSVYDGNNRLASRTLVGQGQAMRVDYTYTADGQVATINRSSDLAGTQLVATTIYTYDAVGNVTDIENLGPGGAVISDFAYQYNAAGEVTNEVDNGSAVNYQYDGTGQLTGDGNNSYAYDPNGNRANSGYVTGPDNQVLSDGVWNYTYDMEGNEATKTNIATGDQWSYGYDNQNHLVSAVEKDSQGNVEVQAEYKYDAFGNRNEKDVTVGGATTVTRYALDGWNPAKPTPVGNENFDVVADINGNGSLTTRYLRDDNVDQLFGRVDSTGANWTLTDRLGSVRQVVGNNGTVKDSIAYDAFGNITSETNAADRGRYAWTGRELDAETGLQYNRARYYDSTTGRWISHDPMGFDAGDSNLYRYVKNAPTIATDSSGMQEVIVQPAGAKVRKVEILILGFIPEKQIKVPSAGIALDYTNPLSFGLRWLGEGQFPLPFDYLDGDNRGFTNLKKGDNPSTIGVRILHTIKFTLDGNGASPKDITASVKANESVRRNRSDEILDLNQARVPYNFSLKMDATDSGIFGYDAGLATSVIHLKPSSKISGRFRKSAANRRLRRGSHNLRLFKA